MLDSGRESPFQERSGDVQQGGADVVSHHGTGKVESREKSRRDSTARPIQALIQVSNLRLIQFGVAQEVGLDERDPPRLRTKGSPKEAD
jgi:hypothetical protein